MDKFDDMKMKSICVFA